jgi:hypothetical protein
MMKNDLKAIVDKRIAANFKVESGWGDAAEDTTAAGVGFAHVPARGQLEILMLADTPMFFRGHYIDGRMKPCSHGGCSMCNDGKGTQKRWVFPVYDTARGATRLLELGEAPAGQLMRYAIDYQGLLGLKFKMSKPGGTLRSTISVELSGLARVPAGELPECPDVLAVMSKIWTDQTSKKLLS